MVVVGFSGDELGVEDGTTTTVDVDSSGVVVIGAAAGLEETISGVVSTGALDGAGADETCSGVVEDKRPAGKEESPVLDGGGDCGRSGVDVVMMTDEGAALGDSCSLRVEKRSGVEGDDEDDWELIRELNHDVKFGIWGSRFSLLELDREVGEDEDVAGAVTLAVVSVLIWRFTWRGK